MNSETFNDIHHIYDCTDVTSELDRRDDRARTQSRAGRAHAAASASSSCSGRSRNLKPAAAARLPPSASGQAVQRQLCLKLFAVLAGMLVAVLSEGDTDRALPSCDQGAGRILENRQGAGEYSSRHSKLL
jgi:hypothetical protein